MRHEDAGAVNGRLNGQAVERKGEAFVSDNVGCIGGQKPGTPVVLPSCIVQQRMAREIGWRTQASRQVGAAGGKYDILSERDGFAARLLGPNEKIARSKGSRRKFGCDSIAWIEGLSLGNDSRIRGSRGVSQS